MSGNDGLDENGPADKIPKLSDSDDVSSDTFLDNKDSSSDVKAQDGATEAKAGGEVKSDKADTAAADNDVCGVCLEVVIKTQCGRYGILDGCDHKFCLSCVRRWRLTNPRSENHRLCPTCREPCNFVVPSDFWYKSEEQRNQIISDYRERLSRRYCKYMKHGQYCPNGSGCPFSHIELEFQDEPDDSLDEQEYVGPRELGFGIAAVINNIDDFEGRFEDTFEDEDDGGSDYSEDSYADDDDDTPLDEEYRGYAHYLDIDGVDSDPEIDDVPDSAFGYPNMLDYNYDDDVVDPYPEDPNDDDDDADDVVDPYSEDLIHDDQDYGVRDVEDNDGNTDANGLDEDGNLE